VHAGVISTARVHEGYEVVLRTELHPMFPRKPLRTHAYKENMLALFHDRPGEGYRVADTLDSCNRAGAVSPAVHDARIQLDLTGGVDERSPPCIKRLSSSMTTIAFSTAFHRRPALEQYLPARLQWRHEGLRCSATRASGMSHAPPCMTREVCSYWRSALLCQSNVQKGPFLFNTVLRTCPAAPALRLVLAAAQLHQQASPSRSHQALVSSPCEPFAADENSSRSLSDERIHQVALDDPLQGPRHRNEDHTPSCANQSFASSVLPGVCPGLPQCGNARGCRVTI